MNICKSILKRIGLVALVIVGTPIVLAIMAIIMSLLAICVVLGAIFACLFCSDEHLKAYLDPDNDLLLFD